MAFFSVVFRVSGEIPDDEANELRAIAEAVEVVDGDHVIAVHVSYDEELPED